MDRVNAQQARRILDRLVGYKISPLLWAKVRGGLSAGRVQSVAVRLIVDREREIRAFIPREYWTVTAQLATERDPAIVFPADLVSHRGEKLEITNQEQADGVMRALEGAAFSVASVKRREVRRNAPAPFTTSTLQQEASRKLTLARPAHHADRAGSLRRRRSGRGRRHPRSDHLHAYRLDAHRRLGARCGPRVHRPRPTAQNFTVERPYKSARRRARRARSDPPDRVSRTPDSVAHVLKRDELRLYTLIWERFVASQMAPAVFDQTTVDISAARLHVPRDRQLVQVRRLHPRI